MRLAPIALTALATLAATAPCSWSQGAQTLRLELSATDRFAVENLVGTMRVHTGSGRSVVAVATVHADNQGLADLLKLEQVVGKEGRPTLRVRYPLDQYRELRNPGRADRGNGGESQFEYDGRRVRVGAHGPLLYADLDVQVPAEELDGLFRNMVGTIDADGVRGHVVLDSASGHIRARHLSGDVLADTGSGDVTAENVDGRFSCDTGSGDCAVTDFRGTVLRCDTGSGNVSVHGVQADRLVLDTGSGELSATGMDVREVSADTGSGNVALEATGDRLTRVNADTGSGTVTLRLGPDASFEARGDTGSGEIVSRYADAQPILRGREVIGYRRGDQKTRITVDSGSGDVVIEPGGGQNR